MGVLPLLRREDPASAAQADGAAGFPAVLPQVQAGNRDQRPAFPGIRGRQQTGMMPAASPMNVASLPVLCAGPTPCARIDAAKHSFRGNRHDAGCITDQVMKVPLICGRGRSFAEGLSEETGMMPVALPTK